MNYRSRVSSLFGYLTITACAMSVVALTFFHPSTTSGPPSYFDNSTETYQLSMTKHFSEVMAAIEAMDAFVAVAPRALDIVAPVKRSDLYALYESYNQPGQNWRSAATAYRHIDPGRGAFA